MKAKATAPVRIDLAGGWTDVPPFATSEEEGGVVVNAAVDLRIEVRVETDGPGLVLEAADLDLVCEVPDPRAIVLDGCLDLHKAAVRRFQFGGGSVWSRAPVPPGSGLGSSGALGVALVAAIRAVRGEPVDLLAVVEEAYQLEAADARHAGGRQDQCAAAFGGIREYRFRNGQVTEQELVLPPGMKQTLEEKLVLVYTGQSRVSGKTISRVMHRYTQGDRTTVDALHHLRRTARNMGAALEAGDLVWVGALLDDNWKAQQVLDEGMSTPQMAHLESVAREVGILGAKAVGAGAGGSMLFLSEQPETLGEALRGEGVRSIPLRLDGQGVTVETAGVTSPRSPPGGEP